MIKRTVKIIALVIITGFVVIQFFQVDKTNPPVNAAETLEAAVSVSASVSQILSTSCSDCHSHRTIYPWYTYIQPGGWFMRDHIEKAQSELNFSTFNTYEPKKKARKLGEICEQIEAAAMPLPSYLWLHADAVLTTSQAKILCDWAESERSKIRL